MKQEEFLERLAAKLAALSDSERAQVIDYYREMICDGVENGDEEENLIAGFGTPQDVAAQILEESRSTVPARSSARTSDAHVYEAREPVHTVIVDARNLSIEVCPVPDGPVEIQFMPRENDRVTCNEEDGVFTFHHTIQYSLFHWHGLFEGPRKITVKLPVAFNGELLITTSNAKITAADLGRLSSARFVTSNGRLTLGNFISGSLYAKTSNGSLNVEDVHGETCTAETSNGHITADRCVFPKALNLHTNNGTVHVQNIRSNQMDFYTSNAAVRGTIIGDMREYAVRSHTTNAFNRLPPELVYPEQIKSLNIRTSNGPIDVKFTPD